MQYNSAMLIPLAVTSALDVPKYTKNKCAHKHTRIDPHEAHSVISGAVLLCPCSFIAALHCGGVSVCPSRHLGWGVSEHPLKAVILSDEAVCCTQLAVNLKGSGDSFRSQHGFQASSLQPLLFSNPFPPLAQAIVFSCSLSQYHSCAGHHASKYKLCLGLFHCSFHINFTLSLSQQVLMCFTEPSIISKCMCLGILKDL